MEIQVKVIKVLGEEKFNSKNGEFVKHYFIGEELQGKYPKKIKFDVIGEDRYANMSIVEGNDYNISFDVSSREWKERWYTQCEAWRAVSLSGATQTPSKTQTYTKKKNDGAMLPESPIPSMDDNSHDDDNDVPF